MRFSTDQETKGRILRLILERELSSEGAGQLKIEENKLTEIPVTDMTPPPRVTENIFFAEKICGRKMFFFICFTYDDRLKYPYSSVHIIVGQQSLCLITGL